MPVGGRGKAGGVVRCETQADGAGRAASGCSARTIKGHAVQSCLVEAAVAGADEYYLSLMLDPAQYGVRVTLLREGGVDVEQTAGRGATAACARPIQPRSPPRSASLPRTNRATAARR